MRAWAVDLPKAGVAVAVALCLYSAAGEVVPVLRGARHAVESSPGSPSARELAPASPFSLVPLIEAAARVIPANATYAVAIGQDPATDGVRVAAIPSLLAYALAPRRYTTDIASAQWVITYHQSSEKLGVKIEHEFGLGVDGNAIEVAP